MIPWEEARAHVLERIQVLAPVEVSLDDALGAVCAADLHSHETVPAFANSAMDGYALRSADAQVTPATLRVVGRADAGRPSDREVGAGEAIRTMTGAVVPAGADAVVPLEQTQSDGDRVVIQVPVAPGMSVRHAGEDIRPGDLLARKGTVLAPSHLGVLASVGIRSVPIHRAPRVGVLSTGDELVDDGPLRPGQIRNSNGPMLRALVREMGLPLVDLGMVRDDEELLEAVIARGVTECDAIVTSGGVSMGDFDYVKVVLDRMGAMRWMQVAIKPAKPFAFGIASGVPVFGLPGNPVSVLVSFELFARPALRRMAGRADDCRTTVHARVPGGLPRRRDGKVHFVHVRASRDEHLGWSVAAGSAQGSHQLAAAAASNGLAVVPDGDGILPGGSVEVILTDRA